MPRSANVPFKRPSHRKSGLDLAQCARPIHQHLTIYPHHAVSSFTSNAIDRHTADGINSFPQSSQQSAEEIFVSSPLPESITSIEIDEPTEEQTVVEYPASVLHGHLGLAPTPHTVPSGTQLYYCCKCGDGPQVVQVNPCCANCGAKFCGHCTVKGTR